MELRNARQSDFPSIIQLLHNREEMFRVYPGGQFPFTVTQLRSLAETRCDLTVATVAGAVVGFANLYNLEAGQSAFIGNVVIARAFRGQGLGRVLVSHMINLALAKYDLQQVRISVFSDNTPALLMYTGMGFRPSSVEERRLGWVSCRAAAHGAAEV